MKRLKNRRGQGLTEYTLIVLLVALGFWVLVRDTKVGDELANSWTKIKTCLQDPTGGGCKTTAATGN
jgi:hypothetical protein